MQFTDSTEAHLSFCKISLRFFENSFRLQFQQQQQPCDVSMDYEDNVDPQQLHPRESCSSLSSTDWEDDSGNSEGEEGEGGDNQGVGQPGLGDRCDHYL